MDLASSDKHVTQALKCDRESFDIFCLSLHNLSMPEIPCGGQIFDFAFHPNRPVVYTGLLTGEIKTFGYDEQGNHDAKWVCRPSKKSCRSLELNPTGEMLWSVGKAKSLQWVWLAFTNQTDANPCACLQHNRYYDGSDQRCPQRHPRVRAELYVQSSASLIRVDFMIAVQRAPINRVKHIMEHMLATGDDDGVVKVNDIHTLEMLECIVYLPSRKALGSPYARNGSRIHSSL